MGRLVFIIAHKYVRGYQSYINLYVDNIQRLYDNPIIIIVDNNSEFLDDILPELKTKNNIVMLSNNIESKFELGAYQVGIKFLLENFNLNEINYIICVQDLFIPIQKYDFGSLDNNVKAGSIIGLGNDLQKMDIISSVLPRFNLNNDLEQTNLCWCNSFFVSSEKIFQMYYYLTNIIITTRHESEGSERYLGRLLFEINNRNNFSLDGGDNNYYVNGQTYNCHTVNLFEVTDRYFVKISQQKNENTKDR